MKQKIDINKSLQANKEVVRAEIRHMEQKMWERSRFCDCGADSVLECKCDEEKRRRYMRRVSSKLNKRYGRKAATLMMGANMMES